MKARSIKTFEVVGTAIDQEAIIRIRAELEARLIEDMRTKGYVPVMDITPELYWEYQAGEGNFKFVIIIYGTFVGRKRALDILGMLGPHAIFFEPHHHDYGTTQPDEG